MLPQSRVLSVKKDPAVFIIYGPPKVGKTTLINSLNNNLIFDLEEGTKYLNSLSINIIGIKPPVNESKESKEERISKNRYYLVEAGREIVENKLRYDFITIDTATEFEEMLKPIALEMYKATPMGANFDGKDVLELARGAGYYWIREAFKEYIGKIRKLAPRLILIGHLKETVINKAGKEVSAKDLDLTGKLKTIACAGADAVGYIYRGENSELRISFKTSDEVTCGARPDHLKGQDIKIADYNSQTNDLENINWKLIYPELFDIN